MTLDAYRDLALTISLVKQCQGIITLTGNNVFLISNLNHFLWIWAHSPLSCKKCLSVSLIDPLGTGRFQKIFPETSPGWTKKVLPVCLCCRGSPGHRSSWWPSLHPFQQVCVFLMLEHCLVKTDKKMLLNTSATQQLPPSIFLSERAHVFPDFPFITYVPRETFLVALDRILF